MVRSLEEIQVDALIRRDRQAEREAAWRREHVRFARRLALGGAAVFLLLFSVSLACGAAPAYAGAAWLPGAAVGWMVGRHLLGPVTATLLALAAVLGYGCLGAACGALPIVWWCVALMAGMVTPVGVAMGWIAETWAVDHSQI